MNLRIALSFGSFVAASSLLMTASAAPTGTFNYHFDGTASPVWDVTGTYDLSPTVGGDTDVEFTVAVTEDTRGNITGSGNTPVFINGSSSQGRYTVKGKVFRAGSVTKVSPVVKVSGSGMLQGKQRTYSLQATYALTIDSVNRKLNGTGRGSAQASGLGQGPVRDNISAALPPALDPSWDLQTQITTTGKSIAGTAKVTLKNGRQINFKAKGSYVARTGMSTITLTDLTKNTGNMLKLTAFGDTPQLTKITGMLFGQQVK